MRKVAVAVLAGFLGLVVMIAALFAPGADEDDQAAAACVPSSADTAAWSGQTTGPARIPMVGPAIVTSNFGMRVNPGDDLRGTYMLHAGIDIDGNGTQIVAAMAGRVLNVANDRVGGNYVRVDVGGGTHHYYNHLVSGSAKVKVGDVVWPGRLIGTEGRTGNASGVHLHFGVYVNGKPTDPRPWLAQHGVTIPAVGGKVVGGPVVTAPPPSSEAASSSASATPVAAPATSTPASPSSSSGSPAASSGPVQPPAGFPTSVGPWKGQQLVNAGWVIRAGQDLGLDVYGVTLGVMVAAGESALRVLDYGDAVGPDSRGLFQQRDNGAWGSYADRMNPYISATNFFKVLKTFDYRAMPPTLAAHRVQRNADPSYHGLFWKDAIRIVAALTANPELLKQLPASGSISGDGGGGVGACTEEVDGEAGGGPLPAVAGEKQNPTNPRRIHDFQLVKFLRWATANGCSVHEHPLYPPVTPGVHLAPEKYGWHYLGGAADLNCGPQGSGRKAANDAAVCQALRMGVHGVIWMAPGHHGHIHVDVSNHRRIYSDVKGSPGCDLTPGPVETSPGPSSTSTASSTTASPVAAGPAGDESRALITTDARSWTRRGKGVQA